MARNRYRKRNESKIFQWLYFCIFAVITIWLLSSIFFKKSPLELLKRIQAETKTTDSTLLRPSYERLTQIVDSTSAINLILDRELAICRGEKNYKKGIIDIESSTVNMRSLPSLSGEIILQIPDSSIVQIQYYDTNKYVLDGKYGQWCKILYADEEGWVWGNYLKNID